MGVDFMAEFVDCMPDIIIAQLVTHGTFGDPSEVDPPIPITCMLIHESRQVRLDAGGKTALSTVHAILSGDFDLNATNYRFTIPDRFTPAGTEGSGAGLEAVTVETISDEDGPCYQTVMLP